MIEEEGNLGRTDVLASIGLIRRLGSAGALAVHLKVPLSTRVRGAQVDYPAIVSIGWVR